MNLPLTQIQPHLDLAGLAAFFGDQTCAAGDMRCRLQHVLSVLHVLALVLGIGLGVAVVLAISFFRRQRRLEEQERPRSRDRVIR